MWTYIQKTGVLSRDGVVQATGYSGFGEGKNNPAMQEVPDIGPIPCGQYLIGAPFDSPEHGPYALHLEPYPTNEMHNRSGFLCHGDAIHAPGTASRGCMIFGPVIRHEMWEGGDHKLTVKSGLEQTA